MNIYTIYRSAVKTLADAGCDSPEYDAQQLIEASFGLNKTQLLMNNKDSADENKTVLFEELLRRRASREPLQYILGEWSFNRFRFKVGPGVLIPRPETELLPEFAIDSLRKNPGSVVYDLCCGSGCIGITVAKLFPTVRVYCIDLSDAALAFAEENRRRIGVENVKIVKADVTDGCSILGLPQPDLILSNPPYVPSAELPTLQPEVIFEPQMALDGGEDGLRFYREIADKWFPFLHKGGFLALECGEGQSTDILALFVSLASGGKLIRDAFGTERVVVLRR